MFILKPNFYAKTTDIKVKLSMSFKHPMESNVFYKYFARALKNILNKISELSLTIKPLLAKIDQHNFEPNEPGAAVSSGHELDPAESEKNAKCIQ